MKVYSRLASTIILWWKSTYRHNNCRLKAGLKYFFFLFRFAWWDSCDVNVLVKYGFANGTVECSLIWNNALSEGEIFRILISCLIFLSTTRENKLYNWDILQDFWRGCEELIKHHRCCGERIWFGEIIALRTSVFCFNKMIISFEF